MDKVIKAQQEKTMTNTIRKHVRELGGIMQAAEATGISKSTIGRACVSGQLPTLAAAIALADALGMDDQRALEFFRAVAPVLRGKTP